MVLRNSIIEAGNIYCGALLLSISLKLFENTPLRGKKNNECRQQRCFFFLMLLFKDLCQTLELHQISDFERGHVLSRKTVSRDHTLGKLDSRGKEKDKYSLRA